MKAVWGLEKAAREVTPTRERISINGLWRWQPATQGASAPPADGWGHLKVPGPWPGIVDYLQHDAQTLFPHPRWRDVKLAELTAAWYQREITIPSAWKGRRIALGVEYVNSLASVFVDGQPAGELRFPGGELDLTGLHLAPGPHELGLLVVALPLRGVMLSYTDSASARRVKGSVPRRGPRRLGTHRRRPGAPPQQSPTARLHRRRARARHRERPQRPARRDDRKAARRPQQFPGPLGLRHLVGPFSPGANRGHGARHGRHGRAAPCARGVPPARRSAARPLHPEGAVHLR